MQRLLVFSILEMKLQAAFSMVSFYDFFDDLVQNVRGVLEVFECQVRMNRTPPTWCIMSGRQRCRRYEQVKNSASVVVQRGKVTAQHSVDAGTASSASRSIRTPCGRRRNRRARSFLWSVEFCHQVCICGFQYLAPVLEAHLAESVNAELVLRIIRPAQEPPEAAADLPVVREQVEYVGGRTVNLNNQQRLDESKLTSNARVDFAPLQGQNGFWVSDTRQWITVSFGSFCCLPTYSAYSDTLNVKFEHCGSGVKRFKVFGAVLFRIVLFNFGCCLNFSFSGTSCTSSAWLSAESKVRKSQGAARIPGAAPVQLSCLTVGYATEGQQMLHGLLLQLWRAHFQDQQKFAPNIIQQLCL
ncbi:hypothetical protein SS50377_27771 [Spironucleus salmonicida]|uniref:Uncharacterized protein n=1 Tax=Spironucleus salmonicida TaxID=348837 RepID=A0A9P8LKU5_9EUKA|nr:hypothetical protein SS50377_27771 [Spironucleus salmonicida]